MNWDYLWPNIVLVQPRTISTRVVLARILGAGIGGPEAQELTDSLHNYWIFGWYELPKMLCFLLSRSPEV